MHVAIAGGSGLIGSALTRSLREDGHQVTSFVRRAPAAPGEVQWRPDAGELDPASLAGADAVVCLSGANVGGKRWTDSYKQTLLRSRVDSVGTIARTLAAMGSDAPRTFLAGCAVGYYGDTGDREVDESAPPGPNFLAQLCVQWEEAAQPAADAGVRVANLRSGIVVDRAADLIKRLRPIVLAGAGGRLGSGRQFLSWIALADEVRAIRFLLDADVSGPVNVCSPNPVRNADFIATYASVLHRPAKLPVPGIALRIVLGEVAQDALTGARVVPAKLRAAGFHYQLADIESALRAALDRPV
jgi:uncharacterized protein (TIGR01777 family)